MNKDDLIRLAREAGLVTHVVVPEDVAEKIKHFANLVAEAEREACADMVLTLTCMGNAKECFEVAATYIRARGLSEQN